MKIKKKIIQKHNNKHKLIRDQIPGENTPLFLSTLIYDVDLSSASAWTGSCCFTVTPVTCCCGQQHKLLTKAVYINNFRHILIIL